MRGSKKIDAMLRRASVAAASFPKVHTIPVGTRVVRWVGGKVVFRGTVTEHVTGRDNRGKARPGVRIKKDDEGYAYTYLDGEGIALE